MHQDETTPPTHAHDQNRAGRGGGLVVLQTRTFYVNGRGRCLAI